MKEQQTLKRRYRLIRIPKMSNYIFTQSTPNKLRLSSSNQLSSTTLHCFIALILLLYITSDCILSSQSFCPKYNIHSWRIHRDYNLLSLQQQKQPQQQIHDKQQCLKQQQQQQPLYLQQRYPQTILFESTSSSSTTAQNNHNHNKRRRKATALKAIAKSSTSKMKRSSTTSKDTANDNQTKIKMNKSRSTTASSTTSKKQVRHSTRAERLSSSGNIAAGAWYQRDEMMQHDILTKEDEIILGRKIVHAKKLRDDMIDLLEKKKLLSLVGEEEKEGSENSFDDHSDLYCLTDEIIYGEDKKLNECWEMKYGYDYDGITEYMDNDYHNDNDDKYDEYELNLNSYFNDINQNGHGDTSTEQITSQSRNNGKVDRRTSSTLVQDGSKLIISSIDSDLKLLSDHEVQTVLKIKGGKLELRHLLHEGAKARNKLMRSNIRLVVSIGKKWMGGNKDSGGIADRYNGSWDRPSLDEVIQEGMLGLARAVDKYDPDRGLRFSTYSTHWITSYVRQCFQAAATGCLKVPSQLHDIKTAYKSAVKRYIEASEAIPSEEQIADEIGVSLSRLRKAIRVTESLLSIDEPVYSGGNAAFKGSGAGGDMSGENSLLISDRLECTDIAPDDYVESGFLRQSLENAMASELSPYERDILRLRLGLDDGQTRTVKQVVEECGGEISISEVRSAERRAFKKLRSPNAVHAHNLVAYLEMADIDSGSFDLY